METMKKVGTQSDFVDRVFSLFAHEIKISSGLISRNGILKLKIAKVDLLLEGKTTILVGVEEADETVGLALRRGEVALVSEEVEDLKGADKGVAVSVKSLEGGVRGEVADGAKTLAGGLEASLTVADSNKHFFESALRLES